MVIHCGVQPDAAGGTVGENSVGCRREEAKSGVGEEQMGQTVGGHGVGTGDHTVSQFHCSGEQREEQLMPQTVMILQLIDPGALSQSGVIQAEISLVRDGA